MRPFVLLFDAGGGIAIFDDHVGCFDLCLCLCVGGGGFIYVVVVAVAVGGGTAATKQTEVGRFISRLDLSCHIVILFGGRDGRNGSGGGRGVLGSGGMGGNVVGTF